MTRLTKKRPDPKWDGLKIACLWPFAIVGVVMGILCTITVVLAPIGVPIIFLSVTPIARILNRGVQDHAARRFNDRLAKSVGPDLYPWEEV